LKGDSVSRILWHRQPDQHWIPVSLILSSSWSDSLVLFSSPASIDSRRFSTRHHHERTYRRDSFDSQCDSVRESQTAMVLTCLAHSLQCVFCSAFGTFAYPAYKTFKAVESSNIKQAHAMLFFWYVCLVACYTAGMSDRNLLLR